MTSSDASPGDSSSEEEPDPGMLVGDVEKLLEVARGHEPGAEGPSTVEQTEEQLDRTGTVAAGKPRGFRKKRHAATAGQRRSG